MTRVADDKNVIAGYGRFSIRELLPRHFRVVDMIVADHSNKVIADTLGMTARSVDMIRKSPLVQQEVARRRKEDRTGDVLGMDRDATVGKARSILEQATKPAAEKIAHLIDHSKDEAIQLNAAKYTLESIFGKPGQSGPQVGVTINVTAEHALLINQAIRESNNEHTIQQPNSPSAGSSEGGQGDVCPQ